MSDETNPFNYSDPPYFGAIAYNGIYFPQHINVEIEALPATNSSGVQTGTTYKIVVGGVLNLSHFHESVLVDPNNPDNKLNGQVYYAGGAGIAPMRNVFSSEGPPGSKKDNALRGGGPLTRLAPSERTARWLLARLSSNGGQLLVSRAGLPHLSVNEPDFPGHGVLSNYADDKVVHPVRAYDINRGPRVTNCKLVPMGSEHICRFDWSCETTISTTDILAINGPDNFPTFLSGSYEDENGNTVPSGKISYSGICAGYSVSRSQKLTHNNRTERTTTGKVLLRWPEVFFMEKDDRLGANYSGPNSELPKILAGLERSIVAKIIWANPVQDNFERESQFQFSEDHKEFSFSFTDRELPSNNPYPEGFSAISAVHTLESSIDSGGFETWQGRLSIDAEVYPHIPKTRIWVTAAQLTNAIVNQNQNRLVRGRALARRVVDSFAADFGTPSGDTDFWAPIDSKTYAVTAKSKQPTSFIKRIYIRDDIFSQRAGIEIDYQLSVSLEYLLAASGALQPLPKWLYDLIDKEEVTYADMYNLVLDPTVYRRAWKRWKESKKRKFTQDEGIPIRPSLFQVGDRYQHRVHVDWGPNPQDIDINAYDPYERMGDPVFDLGVDVRNNRPDRASRNTDPTSTNNYLSLSTTIEVISGNETGYYSYLEDGPQHFGGEMAESNPEKSPAIKPFEESKNTAIAHGIRKKQGGNPDNPLYSSYGEREGKQTGGARRYGSGEVRIVMRGQALRVGAYPVIPEVVGAGRIRGGQDGEEDDLVIPDSVEDPNGAESRVTIYQNLINPVKVGEDRVLTRVVGTGIVGNSGQQKAVYASLWEKEYLLPYAPTTGTILTSTGPLSFV